MQTFIFIFKSLCDIMKLGYLNHPQRKAEDPFLTGKPLLSFSEQVTGKKNEQWSHQDVCREPVEQKSAIVVYIRGGEGQSEKWFGRFSRAQSSPLGCFQ